MTKKQLATVIAGALISGGLLVKALWNVDFKALGGALSHASLPYASLLLVGMVLTLTLRALRWRMLLPAKGATLFTYFKLVTMGLAVNNVLPLRLGEVARALFASEKLKLPLITVFASIFIERLLDAFTILALFLGFSARHAELVWVSRMRTALFPLFGAIAAAFVAAYFVEALLARSAVLTSALKRRPKLHRLFDQLMLGFRPLKTLAAVQILGIGLLLWIADIGNYWAGGLAIDLGQPLPFSYAAVVLASAGFATVVPTLPGYIGAFELVVSESLKPLGVAKEQAFGYAVLVHMVAYLSTTALGMWFLYSDGTSLMDVWRKAQEKRGS